MLGQAPGLVHAAIELGPGNQRAGQCNRTNQTAEDRQHGHNRAVRQRVAGQQLGGSNRGSSTATHAVIEGNHLRHIGHGNTLAANPRPADTQTQRNYQQDHVGGQIRLGACADVKAVQEGGSNRQHHAATGDNDTRTRGNRAGHALEAVQKQKCCDKVGRVNQKRTEHGLLTPCPHQRLYWSA